MFPKRIWNLSMYIHELKNWPKFSWDQETLSELLIQLRHQQGKLIGGMESIGFNDRDATVLSTLTQDVVKSSEIEGEILDKTLVRSSVARHLGMESVAINKKDKQIDGIVEMMLDATQHFEKPLNKERLFEWHTFLFPEAHNGISKIRVGNWRSGIVQVVSGQIGDEIVHFEAPLADRVDYEMELFFNWFNNESKMDFVLKAAIAHLWFVTIHPFDDGNGRIGRALGDLLLARSENSPHRFYSLSAQIQLERKEYYAILEQTQKGDLNITYWVEWFFNCLKRAIKNALSTLEKIVTKADFWNSIIDVNLNERQKKIINRMLDGFIGNLTSSKWAKITKCSQDTAYRDILKLIELGILKKNPKGGRSTNYSLIFPPDRD